MVVTQTLFEHHPRNIYTWISPGDGCRNQIDYIMIKQRFRNAMHRVRTYPGTDCRSDHMLLATKMKLKLKKLHRRRPSPKWQMKLLKTDEEVRLGFREDVIEWYVGEPAHPQVKNGSFYRAVWNRPLLVGCHRFNSGEEEVDDAGYS